MTELPEIQAVLKQFPWARIEKGGVFHFELALAMRQLLGTGPKFGLWAMEEPDTGLTLKKVYESNYGLLPSNFGSILLSDEHFNDEDVWMETPKKRDTVAHV